MWPRALGKRGPKTPLSDAELLVEIRADLKASPFQGEGHRKVRARLKIIRSIPVSNKRVLRLMRENQLLSPYRGRIGRPLLHDGTIVTDAPNLMWGTDGTRILTVEDGWVWVFTAIEHWNAECVGWHVIKLGTRYEALQPIAAGLTTIYGSLGPDVARGLSLRLDHGSQYTSDHFLAQVRFWGIEPSFAFVEEPQIQRRCRALQPNPEGTGHSRPHLHRHRRCPTCRLRFRNPLQQQLASREARLPFTPSSVPVAAA